MVVHLRSISMTSHLRAAESVKFWQIKVLFKSMNASDQTDPDFQNLNPDSNEPSTEPASEALKPPSGYQPRPFTLWRGLQTALAVAFVVASLFTLWTPGSVVESSLEVRMAQALEAASDPSINPENVVPEATREALPTRIGLVAGHYGNDSGSVCDNGVTEMEMNLKIATMVQKKLTDLGYTVDLLQEFDDRMDGYRGRVLVSIHLDSCAYVNDLATGYKVETALSNQNLAAGQKLIACLSDQYGAITGLPYHAGSVTDDMTYYHAFSEIDPITPAAIIEAGFLSMDYQFITEKTEIIADGIVAGILCFLAD